MDQADFRAVVTNQLGPFLADRIRHDDDRPVSLDRSDQGQSDPLVSAGGLHNNRVGSDNAVLLSLLDHIESCPGLDRPSDIKAFHLDQHTGASRLGHALQLDHGCISDSLQNVFVNHGVSSFLLSISIIVKTRLWVFHRPLGVPAQNTIERQ